jgi:hypothetical protein
MMSWKEDNMKNVLIIMIENLRICIRSICRSSVAETSSKELAD